MKLSIIIINYRSKDYLKKCLNSIRNYLKKNNDFNFEVILVNNDKESLSNFRKKYQFSVKIIDLKKNIGFGAANNLASKKASGEFLLFINPDIELKDSSLSKLALLLRKFPELGIVGPRIVEANKNLPQPWTCGKKTSLLNILFRNSINKPWNKNKPTEVDWVSGTALIIGKKLFKELGGFDEKFFMYFEDQDLCLRAKKKKRKILFYPLVKIYHFNGKSWENTKDKKYHFYKSQDYFFQKHHGKFQASLLKTLRRIFKNQ